LLTESQIHAHPQCFDRADVCRPLSTVDSAHHAADEFGTNSYYIPWIAIGLLNAALYAGVRLILWKRLQRPDSSTSSRSHPERSRLSGGAMDLASI
jgi:hypothetical protein